MLKFPCPKCGARLRVAEEHAGRGAHCPMCNAHFRIPDPREASDAIAPEHGDSASSLVTAITTPGTKLPRYPGAGIAQRKSRAKPAKTSFLAKLRHRVGCVGPMILTILGGFAFFGFILPACQLVNQAAQRSQTMWNMKSIGLACNAFYDVHKTLPPPKVVSEKNGKPVELSWRVSILPFMEQKPLFERFDTLAGWDANHNQALLTPMPGEYGHPWRALGGRSNGDTYFQYFTGPNTLWPANQPVDLRKDIPDGTSNTLLFGDAADKVPWTKPADMAVRKNQPIPLAPLPLWVCFVDGHVNMLYREDHVLDATLWMAIDPRDGGVLPRDFQL